MKHHNMNITVTGGEEQQREAVSNIITRSLVDEGFSNVALVNTRGEPMVGSHVPSLLETIRTNNPEFLQTPVYVRAIALATDTDTLDNIGDRVEEAMAKNSHHNGLAFGGSFSDDGMRITGIGIVEHDASASGQHNATSHLDQKVKTSDYSHVKKEIDEIKKIMTDGDKPTETGNATLSIDSIGKHQQKVDVEIVSDATVAEVETRV